MVTTYSCEKFQLIYILIICILYCLLLISIHTYRYISPAGTFDCIFDLKKYLNKLNILI